MIWCYSKYIGSHFEYQWSKCTSYKTEIGPNKTVCCLQETHFNYKDTYKLKVNGEKYMVLTLVKTGRSSCVNFR